ncbi:MAG: hypothetical protein AB1Z23_01670 [Eubacteriales bacterium]
MKKKIWKIIVVITLVLAIGTAATTASAEEDDIPRIYSITVPFLQ